MLRNLLFQYPNDIEGLLLYSIVAKNKEGSIQALKRILQIDQDHEIAFAKLSKLKHAPPELLSIPTPTAPLPTNQPIPTPKPSLIPIPDPDPVQPMPQPTSTEKEILRKRLEANKASAPLNVPVNGKKKKKKRIFDIVLIGLLTLLIMACLCVSMLAVQKMLIFFIPGS